MVYQSHACESKHDGTHAFGPRCIIKKHMEHCIEHDIWRKYGDPCVTCEEIRRADMRRQEQEKKRMKQQQEKAQEASKANSWNWPKPKPNLKQMCNKVDKGKSKKGKAFTKA